MLLGETRKTAAKGKGKKKPSVRKSKADTSSNWRVKEKGQLPLNSANHKKQPQGGMLPAAKKEIFARSKGEKKPNAKSTATTVRSRADSSSNWRVKEKGLIQPNTSRHKSQPQGGITPGSTSAQTAEKATKQLTGEEIAGHVQKILDDLTPETLTYSASQLKELKVSTEESLEDVTNLIFEGAMTHPNSSALHAYICRCLLKIHVPSTYGPVAKVTFHTTLVRLCTVEFNKRFGSPDVAQEKKTGFTNGTREPQEEANTCSRSVSIVRYIGELFKVKIMSKTFVHSCIRKLLSNRDAESLECLCALLRVISQDLEELTPKQVMDCYYNQMNAMAEGGKTSTKTALMLKNTIDLRQVSLFKTESTTSGSNGCNKSTEDKEPMLNSGNNGKADEMLLQEQTVKDPVEPSAILRRRTGAPALPHFCYDMTQSQIKAPDVQDTAGATSDSIPRDNISTSDVHVCLGEEPAVYKNPFFREKAGAAPPNQMSKSNGHKDTEPVVLECPAFPRSCRGMNTFRENQSEAPAVQDTVGISSDSVTEPSVDQSEREKKSVYLSASSRQKRDKASSRQKKQKRDSAWNLGERKQAASAKTSKADVSDNWRSKE